MTRHLILIPTEQERRILRPILEAEASGVEIELCGFGIAAAAARTMQLLEAVRPAQVTLLGIAGRLDDRLPIGTAWLFDRVASYGIGVGTGVGFIGAESMGWMQWPGDPPDSENAIVDTISCTAPGHGDVARAGLLLTACAAAASDADVRLRHRTFPEASAEDMEGFAVALACRIAKVPCRLIRGISNTAGNRDHANWRVPDALAAAADLALQLMKRTP